MEIQMPVGILYIHWNFPKRMKQNKNKELRMEFQNPTEKMQIKKKC